MEEDQELRITNNELNANEDIETNLSKADQALQARVQLVQSALQDTTPNMAPTPCLN